MSGLFSLSVETPTDTNSIKFRTLGPLFGKKKFYAFIKEFENVMSIKLDAIVYSRIVIECSTVDEMNYYKLSLNENNFLPIAGRQLSILEIESNKNEMSLIGFAESFNFILNDSRIYEGMK